MGNDILDDILALCAVLPVVDKPTKSISDNLILQL